MFTRLCSGLFSSIISTFLPLLIAPMKQRRKGYILYNCNGIMLVIFSNKVDPTDKSEPLLYLINLINCLVQVECSLSLSLSLLLTCWSVGLFFSLLVLLVLLVVACPVYCQLNHRLCFHYHSEGLILCGPLHRGVSYP